MKNELFKKINQLNKNLSPEIDDGSLLIRHPEFGFDKSFPMAHRSDDELVQNVEDFLQIKYIKGKCLYKKDYAELLIDLFGSNLVNTLSSHKFSIEKDHTLTNINYEISQISETFFEFVSRTLLEFEYGRSKLTSLKIYYLDEVLTLSLDNTSDFEKKVEWLAKSIIFDISHKSSICLKLIDVSQVEKNESPKDILGNSKLIAKKSVISNYDQDLIQYYYRAIQMEPSEFQYLAFYQVLECIFDEVYLSETISDARKIIESSWFSPAQDKDIEGLINMIDRYHKEKDDREKTRLVLQKYFKGETRDEAYFLANGEIINILQQLKKIKDNKEAKDLQKLTNIVYDFRSKCVHSNRTYPFRTEFQNSPEELELYIALIKKIAEKIILNYRIR